VEYGVVGTLLGPEGTGRPPGSRGVGVGLWQGRSVVVPLLRLRVGVGLASMGDRCLVVR
jgi:hypothetical protein